MGQKSRNSINGGFTIVELLIVVVVIAILAAITIVSYNGITRRATEAQLKSETQSVVKQLETTRALNGAYPTNATNLKVGTNTYLSYTNLGEDYCVEVYSTQIGEALKYYSKGSDTTVREGSCPVAPPPGYQVAPVAGGASIAVNGYTGIQPESCPATGGVWTKVPGNSLYGLSNGFCIQRYPASNVSNVATSQASGNRWTALLIGNVQSSAATAATGAHLLTDYEWMTMASNAAIQPSNWSGGSVGNGTLPVGSAASTRGTLSVVLSNGERVYFDTGVDSYYAVNEFTCYTGPNASNCGLASSNQPTPAASNYADEMNLYTSFGSLMTNGAGHYYGDARFANPSLGTYITSAQNKGLGFLRTSYPAGTVYSFTRGEWNGADSSGLFSLSMSTAQNYAHATYGFRAAK